MTTPAHLALLCAVLLCLTIDLPGRSVADAVTQVAPVTSGWTIDETLKVRNVDDVQISPDGRRVLFTVTAAVLTHTRSDAVSRIHVVNVDGSGERPLTADTYAARSPQWSPDGRWVAFLANRSTTTQLWLLSPDGGEAHALTSGDRDVMSFKWSPSGRHIAFLRPDGLSPAEERAQRAKDDAIVVGRNLTHTRIWLVPVGVNGAAATPESPLTPSGTSISEGFDWSPDGSTLAVVQTRSADWREWPSSDIGIVHATSGAVRPVVQSPTADTAPLFSPDGRHLAYLASRDTWGRSLDVRVLDLASSTQRKLADTQDGQPALIGWSVNGDRLYVSEGRGTATRFSALPLSGAPPEDLDPGGLVLSSFALSPTRTQVAFTRQTITGELAVQVGTTKKIVLVGTPLGN